MRIKAGLGATAAAVMLIAGGAAWAQSMGGFRGGGGFPTGAPSLPGIGVGAYESRGGAPLSGPVGARAWNGGNFDGREHVLGFLGGYGYGGGYGGGYDNDTVVVAPGGTSVYNYTYYDARPHDGGYYSAGGVFYPDDGYDRSVYAAPGRRRYAEDDAYTPAYRPLRHVYDLPTTRCHGARKHRRCITQY